MKNKPDSHQVLRQKLNGEAFAEKFYQEKLRRAKHLIGDILMVTSGDAEVIEKHSQFGHHHLIDLLETLSTKHENFSVIDFISDLQEFVFTQTNDYTESRRKWHEKSLAFHGLDVFGVEIEGANDNWKMLPITL